MKTLEYIKKQSKQPDMGHLTELALRLPLQTRTWLQGLWCQCRKTCFVFLFSFLCTYRLVSLLFCQWSEEVGAVKSIWIYSCSLSMKSVSLHNWPSDGPLEKNRGMQVTSLFSGRFNWKLIEKRTLKSSPLWKSRCALSLICFMSKPALDWILNMVID